MFKKLKYSAKSCSLFLDPPRTRHNTKFVPYQLISGANKNLIMITRRIIEMNSNPFQDFLLMRQTILLLSL